MKTSLCALYSWGWSNKSEKPMEKCLGSGVDAGQRTARCRVGRREGTGDADAKRTELWSQVPGAPASLLTTADASPVISRLFGTRTGVKGTKVRKILLCILGNSMGFSSTIILCIHKTKPGKSP